MIEYLTIAVIALLASISPGPDFVIVVKNALTHNRNMAVMTALGVGTGILVHTLYCVLGLALIIAHSILLFKLIKYLGAAYLIYLGLEHLSSKTNPFPDVSRGHPSSSQNTWKAFRDGLLTNVFNPKVTLFMLSIFTAMIHPHTSRFIQASYGIEIACVVSGWFVFLSFGLTHPYVLTKIAHVQSVINKAIGLVLLLLGVVVVVR